MQLMWTLYEQNGYLVRHKHSVLQLNWIAIHIRQFFNVTHVNFMCMRKVQLFQKKIWNISDISHILVIFCQTQLKPKPNPVGGWVGYISK